MIRPALLRLIQYAAANLEELDVLAEICNLSMEESAIIAATASKQRGSPYYITNIINEINTTQDANDTN